MRDLETTLENSKYALSRTLKASEATKILQQGNSTLKPNKLLEDNPNLQQVQEPTNEVSESVSEAYKSPLKTVERNIPSIDNTTQNYSNFITLGNLSEEEKNKIIQTGFRLNQEGKISLKKYYEGTTQYSLF
jgi:hypothetical protein